MDDIGSRVKYTHIIYGRVWNGTKEPTINENEKYSIMQSQCGNLICIFHFEKDCVWYVALSDDYYYTRNVLISMQEVSFHIWNVLVLRSETISQSVPKNSSRNCYNREISWGSKLFRNKTQRKKNSSFVHVHKFSYGFSPNFCTERKEIQ